MTPTHAVQALVALTILNVWILRFHMATPYRGGDARNLREEFQVYGLPTWALPTIGVAKLACAGGLLAGIWVPALTEPAATVLGVLMAGAVAMHVKVGDPAVKSAPAATLLSLCALLVLG